MDNESIKELATSFNNAAAAAFQSGVKHAEKPLLTKIKRYEEALDRIIGHYKSIGFNATAEYIEQALKRDEDDGKPSIDEIARGID